MAGNDTFIKRHAVLVYFILAFVITWGGVLLVSGGLAGLPATKDEFARIQPRFIPAVLGGPLIGGILMIALVRGKTGFTELWTRLSKGRVGLGWYCFALGIAPFVLMGELLVLSRFSPAFTPGILLTQDKISALVAAIIAGLIVGICEELGWTGFAVPQLRMRWGVVATGLIVGVLWGAWHIFLNAFYVSRAYSADLPPALFVLARGLGDLVGLLPAYRVLLVWMHERTGSLLLVILMHASLTASTIFTDAPGIAGGAILIYDLISTILMWGIVAVVALTHRGQFGLPNSASPQSAERLPAEGR